ncbi:MAG TPA: hypothetical protein VLH94_01055, partial [Spirochaetia bacterium]|nr:hypothetical protein [Spirochaetia bacterium]
APMTVENQNKVAYYQIKEWKDKGLTPAQIASKWNSGDENAYKKGHKGYNAKLGVSYDTPAYTMKVSNYYNELKGGVAPQPTKPVTPIEMPKEKEPTLGEQLGTRLEEGGKAIESIIGGKEKTGQTRVSGLLQTAGAVAGGIGDVVTKGLELIPGVKQIENLIGKGAQAFFNTEGGQSVINTMKNFSEKHPELSKDLEAGFNIVTAIPILKGLGAVKNLAVDAASSALKSTAEKAMITDLTEMAGRSLKGKNFLARNPETMQTLIKERAIPDIVDGKISTKNARFKVGEQISMIEDGELQPLLESVKTSGIKTSFVSLEQTKQQAIKLAEKALEDIGPVEKYFDRIKKVYGEFPDIADLNKAKRTVAKKITQGQFMSPTYNTDKIVRDTLQKAVEDGAKALGLPDVATINQKMVDLFRVQDLLKIIENKPIKRGVVSDIVTGAATVGGEALGNMTGIPFAGALVGRGAGGNIGRKLTGGVEGILKRTGKGAQRVTREELIKKLGGLFGGALSQKTIDRSQ